MKFRSANKSLGWSLLGVLAFAVCSVEGVAAQGRNNPYSPSPAGRGAVSSSEQKAERPPDQALDFQREMAPERPLIAAVSFKPNKPSTATALPPTQTYRVGVGDVLYIRINNSNNGAGHFTVRADNTIDYPLAGEKVGVGGMTTESIEEMLASAIKLFRNPNVEVRVTTYASHAINVSGLVRNAGRKVMQRDAMPLFAIRAEALVDPSATSVTIKRRDPVRTEQIVLRDATADETLIFPGDEVVFIAEAKLDATNSFSIKGEIAAPGRFPVRQALTLKTAIAAAGGSNSAAKRVLISRKNARGKLSVTEFDLAKLMSGSTMDPFVGVGDEIEIKN